MSKTYLSVDAVPTTVRQIHDMGATLRRWTWRCSLLDADDGRGEHGAALGDFPEERVDLGRKRLDVAAWLDGDMVMGSDKNHYGFQLLRVGSYILNKFLSAHGYGMIIDCD